MRFELGKIHRQIFDAMNEIIETPLRQPPDVRHLAAFKGGAGATAGAGVLALVASGAGFAPAAAGPTAHALTAGLGSGSGFKVVQSHNKFLLN
jgi:hypothetical protein